MGNILPFASGRPGGAEGPTDSGPEGPNMENRVSVLEDKLGRIERVLESLAPRIVEIHAKMATQADITEMRKEIQAISAKIGSIDGRIDGINGRLEGIDKRIGGVEGRFSQVPTIWGMLGILATLMLGMAGLIFTAGKYLR